VTLGGRDSTPVRGVPYEPVVSSQAPEDCAFGNTIPEQSLSPVELESEVGGGRFFGEGKFFHDVYSRHFRTEDLTTNTTTSLQNRPFESRYLCREQALRLAHSYCGTPIVARKDPSGVATLHPLSTPFSLLPLSFRLSLLRTSWLGLRRFRIHDEYIPVSNTTLHTDIWVDEG
jgi:hypothetical protein